MKTKIVAALLSATLMAGGAYAAIQDGPTPVPADRNGDGIVTRDEALSAADARFSNLDLDKDGKLTVLEVRASFPPRGRGPGGEGRRARMLERFDADKDGLLSDAERAKARESFRAARNDGPPPPPRGPRPPIDPDGDGEITQAEARAVALARFENDDANHDGRIDQVEREAARPRMRGRRGPGVPPPPPSPPADGPATASGA